jgi:hypothetical protein
MLDYAAIIVASPVRYHAASPRTRPRSLALDATVQPRPGRDRAAPPAAASTHHLIPLVAPCPDRSVPRRSTPGRNVVQFRRGKLQFWSGWVPAAVARLGGSGGGRSELYITGVSLFFGETAGRRAPAELNF